MISLRQVILITFAGSLFLLLLGLGFVFWSQETYPDGQSFERILPDGYVLRGTRYGTGVQTLYLADENMDRYGNLGAVQFHSGLLLARFFSQTGRAFLHYDQRPDASVKQLARDLLVVLDEERVHTIIAQGQGCYTALEAAWRARNPPDRLLLFSCAARENYQELRLEQMLHRMALEGAPANMLSEATALGKKWLRDYELEPLSPAASVGRRMIHNSLEKEKENLGVKALAENQAISFSASLERLKRPGVVVHHYRGEFDAFTPGPPGEEQILIGMDDFLRQTDHLKSAQLELVMAAWRPELARTLTEELEKVLPAKRP